MWRGQELLRVSLLSARTPCEPAGRHSQLRPHNERSQAERLATFLPPDAISRRLESRKRGESLLQVHTAFPIALETGLW